MAPHSHILVRAPNWIGDAVMGTPALMDLRDAYPHAKITLLARPTVAELLEGHPSIDEVLVYDHRGRHKGLRGKIALIRALRLRHFDRAILFQNAFEAALLAFLSGVPERWGYATDGRGIFLSRGIQGSSAEKTGASSGIFSTINWRFDRKTVGTVPQPRGSGRR